MKRIIHKPKIKPFPAYWHNLPSRMLYDEICHLNSMKYSEILVLTYFLDELKFPQSLTIYRSERPDFFIKHKNGYLVGIELGEIFVDSKVKKGSQGKAFLRNWINFSQELRKKLIIKGNGLEYLYGSISFLKNKTLPSKKEFSCLADKIVSILSEKKEKLTERWSNLRISSDELEKIGIKSIYVENTFPEIILWWHPGLQTGEVKDLKSNLIESIKEKNSKFEDYTWKFKKIHSKKRTLLIYLRGNILESSGDIQSEFSPEEESVIRNSPFDSIWYFNMFSQILVDLKKVKTLNSLVRTQALRQGSLILRKVK